MQCAGQFFLFLVIFLGKLQDIETLYYLCVMKREIIAFGDYYTDFMSGLSEKEQLKVRKSLLLFSSVERMPYHYIKHIRAGVYEFRVGLGNNIFRLFFIYDGEKIVVLLNGFRKKTQKTPKREIDKAIKLKHEYYEWRKENL